MSPEYKRAIPMIHEVIVEAQEKIKAVTGLSVKLDFRPYGEKLEDEITRMCLNVIACWEDVELDDIKNDGRKQNIVVMRKILCMLIRHRYPKHLFPMVSLQFIAKMLRIGDHASVLHHANTGLELLSIQDELFLNYYTPVKHFFNEP